MLIKKYVFALVAIATISFSTPSFGMLNQDSLAKIKPSIFSIKDPDFKEVLDKLDSNALVVLDIDETLIIAKDKILRKNPREIISEFMQDNFYDVLEDLYPWDYDKIGYLRSIQSKSAENNLVEPEIISIIQKLRAKNVRIIALTDIYVGKFYEIDDMLEWRFKQLYDLGIDLSIGNQKNIVLENLPKSRTGYPIFYKGILATAQSCKKGPALVELFKQLNLNPSHVVFLDDNKSQIKTVNEELTELNIPCSAFHYKAKEIIKNNINFEVAKFQYKYLIEHETWLSETQAQKLIENKQQKKQFTDDDLVFKESKESFEFNEKNENKEKKCCKEVK